MITWKKYIENRHLYFFQTQTHSTKHTHYSHNILYSFLNSFLFFLKVASFRKRRCHLRYKKGYKMWRLWWCKTLEIIRTLTRCSFLLHLYIYRRNTNRKREITMKESQRTIPVHTYPFCKGCPYEMLNLHTQRLYADNNEYERIHTARCKNAEVCLSLYERLTESFEREDEWN